MKFYIVTIFTLIIFFSCTSKKNYDYSIISFDKEISVEGQKDTIFDSNIGILAIFSVGNYLIAEHVETEHFFSVYSTNPVEYIGSFGKRGNGPGEFSFASCVSEVVENNETKMWVLDASRRLAKINVEKSIIENKAIIEEDFVIKSNYTVRNSFYANNNMFVGELHDNEASKYIYDIDNKEIIYTSPIPLYNQNLEIANNFNRLTRSLACYNKDTKTMVSVSLDLPLINTATLNTSNDSLIMRDIYYKEFIPQEEYKYNYNSMVYFASISSNSDYICALYYGCPYEEEDYLEEAEILLFDTKLKPIVKLKIPMATWITMDENNILYAFNFNVEENMLEVFDLNKILADI